jgi:hypothetical protein
MITPVKTALINVAMMGTNVTSEMMVLVCVKSEEFDEII